MKKLLGILALTAMATSLFAQGTVSFGNQTGLVRQWTSSGDNTLISMPKSGGYVQLIAAPSGTALPNNLFTGNAAVEPLFANYTSLAGFLAANPGWAAGVNASGAVPTLVAAAAGIFNGGTFTIENIGAGAEASYLAVGWTGTATTFDAAMAQALAGNALMGISAIAVTATGNPTTSPPGTAVFTRSTFAGITMAPVYVPEPSVFALAGLGIAALVALRRRN